MSATMSGAWKAYLESLGFGIAVYRDGAPAGKDLADPATYPYVVVTEGVGYLAESSGDTDDPDADTLTTERVQIDLYQLARSLPDAAGRTTVLERYDLPSNLDGALRYSRALAVHAPWNVHGTKVTGGQRWPIADNIVRHTWSIDVRRDTNRKVTP